MTQIIKLEKAFYGDWCDWEHHITATITPELEAQINATQKLIRQHAFISSIRIDVPDDFLAEDTASMLQEQCRFDVDLLEVFSSSFYFYIQGKWDSHVQAEYTVVI